MSSGISVSWWYTSERLSWKEGAERKISLSWRYLEQNSISLRQGLRLFIWISQARLLLTSVHFWAAALKLYSASLGPQPTTQGLQNPSHIWLFLQRRCGAPLKCYHVIWLLENCKQKTWMTSISQSNDHLQTILNWGLYMHWKMMNLQLHMHTAQNNTLTLTI